jgi:hypothetical protein
MSFERLLNTFEDEESAPKVSAPYKPVKYHHTTEEKWRHDKSYNNPEAVDLRAAVPVRKSYN